MLKTFKDRYKAKKENGGIEYEKVPENIKQHYGKKRKCPQKKRLIIKEMPYL